MVKPNDWKLVSLEEIVEFKDNLRRPIKKSSRNSGIYPYYGATGIIGYIDNYIFEGEFILLGEDGANIVTRSYPLVYKTKGRFWLNNHAHIMSPNKEVDIDFLVQLLENKDYSELNSGSAQPKLNLKNVKSIEILLPSIEEQKKIAIILYDIDQLISFLSVLIEKKRLIKKGVSNKLLTGKKRVRGYREDWMEKTLKDVCEVKDGTHQTPKYVKQGIPFYSVENISNDDFFHTKNISLAEHKILTEKYKIEKGDILMTRIGSIGVCKYVDWEVNASFYVSLALIKCNELIDAQFLTQLSFSEDFQKEVEQHSLQHAVPKKINLSGIPLIKIKIPQSIQEQKAIATILFDMDEEIFKLEEKLEKYKKIKQGMMEQLLTGKIRLA
ncbi:restriction endonuclease subunit S [Enterococcus sp. LJL51]|uniref:restriction endonuclease subunit S n=1 Tax=Enterococcus sp. LJL51 TaxID=3416656 RepID=UPI003CF47044